MRRDHSQRCVPPPTHPFTHARTTHNSPCTQNPPRCAAMITYPSNFCKSHRPKSPVMVPRSSQVRNNFFRRMWTSTSSIVGPEGLCQESFLEMLGGAAVYLGGRVGGLFPCKCWLGLQFRGTSSGMEPGWLECAIRFALACVWRVDSPRMHPPQIHNIAPK